MVDMSGNEKFEVFGGEEEVAVLGFNLIVSVLRHCACGNFETLI